MKYGEVTFGQVEALINKLGGMEVVEALLREEKTVTIEDAIRLLVDKNGRWIPEGLRANVCDPNRSFRLDQPNMTEVADFASRLQRLHECLGIDTGITAEQFKVVCEHLSAIIEDDPQIRNLRKAVCLPVVLPQFITDDLGT